MGGDLKVGHQIAYIEVVLNRVYKKEATSASSYNHLKPNLLEADLLVSPNITPIPLPTTAAQFSPASNARCPDSVPAS